jgi:hypothetical protein
MGTPPGAPRSRDRAAFPRRACRAVGAGTARGRGLRRGRRRGSRRGGRSDPRRGGRRPRGLPLRARSVAKGGPASRAAFRRRFARRPLPLRRLPGPRPKRDRWLAEGRRSRLSPRERGVRARPGRRSPRRWRAPVRGAVRRQGVGEDEDAHGVAAGANGGRGRAPKKKRGPGAEVPLQGPWMVQARRSFAARATRTRSTPWPRSRRSAVRTRSGTRG